MSITKFSFPTTIHFGPGARRLVGEHLNSLGLTRPLIVTDKGLAALPLIAEISAEAAKKQSLPVGELESYLRDNIDYTLDRDNMAGLEMYYQLAAKLGLIPRAKPIEWATAGDVVRVPLRF